MGSLTLGQQIGLVSKGGDDDGHGNIMMRFIFALTRKRDRIHWDLVLECNVISKQDCVVIAQSSAYHDSSPPCYYVGWMVHVYRLFV